MSDQPYRVWHIPQVPGEPFFVPVKDLDTANLVLETLALYDAFQFEQRIKPDYSNVGGIEEWLEDEAEWSEVDDELVGRRSKARS